MASTVIKKRYILIPVIYLIVSISFLVLHFTDNNTASGKDTIFVLDWEALAEYTGNDGSPGAVSIQSGELSLVFSKENPLILTDSNQKEKRVLPEKYTAGEKTLSIQFEDDLMLNINADNSNPDFFVFSFDLPAGSSYSEIRIPLVSASEIYTQSIIPAAYTSSTNGTTMIIPEKNIVLDKQTGHLVLPADNSKFSVTHLEKAADPLVYWFTDNGNFTSQGEYEESVQLFLDKTYAGLSDYRYSKTRGNWKLKPFEEKSLSVLMAESLNRNRLAKDWETLNTVWKNQRYLTGIAASHFFGNIIRVFESEIRSIKKDISKLSEKASKKDMSLFEEENLIIFMKSLHEDKLNRNTADFLNEIKDSYKPDLVSLTAIMEIYLDQEDIEGMDKVNFTPFKTCIESYVLANISQNTGTLHFMETADTRLLIRMGIILLRLGEKEGNALLQSIGRDLLITILSYADKSGLLPENGNSSSSKTFPELVYSLFSDKFYPKQIKKDNILVYTFCGTEITKKGSSVVFEFSYLKGLPHNTAIEGLGSVAEVVIDGKSSEPDPGFQFSETGGWFYDKGRDVLYLKLKQDSEKEKVYVAR